MMTIPSGVAPTTPLLHLLCMLIAYLKNHQINYAFKILILVVRKLNSLNASRVLRVHVCHSCTL